EKVVEKRRALGRGLESLLPGPRVVSAPTLPQSTRKDGAAFEGGATGVPGAAGDAVVSGEERGRVAPTTAGEGAGATADGRAVFEGEHAATADGIAGTADGLGAS